MIPVVYPRQIHLWDLVIHFSCYLFNRPFYYVLSVPIFYSKIILLPLHPVVGLSSCILNLLVGRIFFSYFGISCFICIVWPCPGIFWVSLLLPISFDSSLKLNSQTCLLYCFGLFIPEYPRMFSLQSTFAFCRSFFTCSSLISPPGFVFLFGSFGGKPILSRTRFAPT